jgi:uncharacterized membrane protein
MIKLIGIAIVAIGFAFRFNPLLVVVVAAISTGIAAGFSFHDVLRMIGQYFIDNRFLVLAVILILPVVGVLERHGLQEHVAGVMRRTRAATAGRVMWLYQLVRELTSMIGLNVGGHASMVRPLVVPMAEGAAALPAEGAAALPAEGAAQTNAKGPEATRIRTHAAASENVGNFFADDILVAVGALLLIKGFFDNVGVEVSLDDLKRWSLPTAAWVLVIGWWRYRALDRAIAKVAVVKKP